MADFTFQVKADANTAVRAVANVERGLVRIEAQAAKTGRAVDGAFSDRSGRLRSANGAFVLTSKSAAAAGRSMQAAGSAADLAASRAQNAARGFGGLGNAMRDVAIGATVAVAAKQVFDLAESYANLTNRLRLVSTDQGNLNALLAETKRIAQETRADWASTVEGTVRLSQATKDLGLSQRDVLDFMTSLNKTIIVSGASSAEAKNGLIQLSQGLAAGALRGDELRSVMENLPAVADVLAKGMGHTRGELRKLGAEGKITAEMMIESFRKQKDVIDQNFAKTVPTATQAIQFLKNEAIEFFGAAGQGSGVMRMLASSIKFVADNLDTIGPLILGVAQALLGLYVIEKVVILVRALGLAIAANPLGALIVGLVTLVALLRQFGDRLSAGAGMIATVGDVLRVLWNDIKAVAAAVVDFVENAWNKLTDAFGDGLATEGIELSLKNVLLFIASFVDAAIGLFKFLGNSIVTVFGGIPVFLGEAFIRLAQDVTRVFQDLINKIVGMYNKLRGAIFDTLNQTGEKRLAALEDHEKSWKKRQPALLAQAAATAPSISKFVDMSKMPENFTSRSAADKDKWYQSQPGYADYQKAMDAHYQRVVKSEFDHSRAVAFDRQGLDATGEDPRSGKIGKIDLSFENPLDGAGKAAWQKVQEDFKAALEESTAKDYIASVLDRANQAALNRPLAAKAGNVSTEKGKNVTKAPVDEKAIREMAKLRKEWESLVSQSNPIREAQIKIANAEELATRAVKAGIVSRREANQVLDDVKRKLQDQLDPYSALIEKLGEEYNAITKTEQARERDARVESLRNEMLSKGIELSDMQLRQVEKMVTLIQTREESESRQRALFEEITAASTDYNNTLTAANALLANGKISFEQYALAIDRAKTAYVETTPYAKTFEYGLKSGLRSIKEDIIDVATTVRTTLSNAFSSVEGAIVDLVTKGKADWSGMIQSMLADMTKLLMRWILMKTITGITGDGPEALSTGITGFATGGGGIVGGSGGTDSKFVAFRATPGETVTVTRPGQGGQASGASERRTERPVIVKNITITDPNQAVAAMDSRRGQRLAVQTLNAQNKLVRSHVTRR